MILTKVTADTDLAGKTVLLHQSYFKPGFNAADHPFLCRDGFGCFAACSGQKIIGDFVSNGETAVILREHVDSIVEG